MPGRLRPCYSLPSWQAAIPCLTTGDYVPSVYLRTSALRSMSTTSTSNGINNGVAIDLSRKRKKKRILVYASQIVAKVKLLQRQALVKLACVQRPAGLVRTPVHQNLSSEKTLYLPGTLLLNRYVHLDRRLQYKFGKRKVQG